MIIALDLSKAFDALSQVNEIERTNSPHKVKRWLRRPFFRLGCRNFIYRYWLRCKVIKVIHCAVRAPWNENKHSSRLWTLDEAKYVFIFLRGGEICTSYIDISVIDLKAAFKGFMVFVFCYIWCQNTIWTLAHSFSAATCHAVSEIVLDDGAILGLWQRNRIGILKSGNSKFICRQKQWNIKQS